MIRDVINSILYNNNKDKTFQSESSLLFTAHRKLNQVGNRLTLTSIPFYKPHYQRLLHLRYHFNP